MVVFPNAKINIGLFVTGKRPDGFHNLETVFIRWGCLMFWKLLKETDVPGNIFFTIRG